MNEMSEYRIEVVGVKNFKKHKMPSADEVHEKLVQLWTICWKPEEDSNWDPRRPVDCKPLGAFVFPRRPAADPVFRVRDFERGREDGIGGMDLLGTYHHRDNLVTIYIDSCSKAARRYKVLLEDLVDVVLIHELAHLVTHRGFETDDLSTHFMEFTAQCATYAYLKANADRYERFGYSESNADSYAKWGHLKAKDDQILKAFEHLSEHQPFVYQTWESLKELPRCLPVIMSRPSEIETVVKAFFQGVLYTLRPITRDEIHEMVGY